MKEKNHAQVLRKNGPAIGTHYRHYKGRMYEVIENVIHEATLEHLVIYKDAEGNVWARAFDDWSAFVEINGEKVPRFALEIEKTRVK